MSSGGSLKTTGLKADLVIIGGGGAGLAAAVAAAEKGATNVIVLEKRGTPGGNTALAHGIFGVNSPAQRREAIEFDWDELFKMAMMWAHWKSNPRIVRAFMDRSGDTIRWLEEKGLYFKLPPIGLGQSPLVWHVPKGLGAAIVKVLANECQKMGARILTRTPAKKLLTGVKGNVTGVLAESKGEEFTITAQGVIIATGGYGGNRKLLRKYYPEYHDNLRCGGVPHTGDGLLMAMEIGAATEGLGLLLGGGLGVGKAAGPSTAEGALMKLGSGPDTIKLHLAAIVMEPETVWVNNRGERFVDESIVTHYHNLPGPTMRQPDHVHYVLLDRSMVRNMTEHGLLIGFGGHIVVEQRTGLPGLEEGLRAKANEGLVKISDTWEGIADWIGADPRVLKATIEEYNSACDRGHDPIFAKNRRYLVPLRTPPYYAIIAARSGFLDTVGGIKINERMQVLDKKDNPILGLYAAGVVAGGWQAETYCILPTSGAAAGFAINSGRIAAENAVKFAAGRTK